MKISKVLESARSGIKALEAHQDANPEDELDFEGVDFRDPNNAHIDFSGFEFRARVNFRKSTFGVTPIPFRPHGYPRRAGTPEGGACFTGAVFHKHAIFADCVFGDGAQFGDVIWKENAVFGGATFGDNANFSRAVIKTGSFGHCAFGRGACFDEALFVESCSFEETIFGERASFQRVVFERAHFQSSLFGDDANFELAVFSALAQFNNTEFGAGACFLGTAFNTRAGFENAVFSDHASFRGVDRQRLLDLFNDRAQSLPSEFASIVLERAQASDPATFERASFAGATFSGDQHRYATVWSNAEGVRARIVEGAKEIFRRIRILFYSSDGLKRSGPTGATFANRQIKELADFSLVRFDQPPDFQGVEPASSLDFAESRFSFRATSWPYFRYWTTRTVTLTRLRRLRKIAKDIDETDIERDLFFLQRMAQRGVAWRVWWDDVLLGWGIYHLISARLKAGRTGIVSIGQSRMRKLLRSVVGAIKGFWRPLLLTILVALYRYSSDFGRSFMLPFVWFAVFVVAFARWYAQFTTGPKRAFWDADLLAFSFSHSFPISPMARGNFDDFGDRLFPNGLPAEAIAIVVGQTVLQTIMLFLVAMALRNYFRVR